MTDRAPRELLVYPVGSHTFTPGDYPWLTSIRVCMQASQGGGSSNGTPGQMGEFASYVIDVGALPSTVPIVIGKGGRGAPGGTDGEDGFVVIELYDVP